MPAPLKIQELSEEDHINMLNERLREYYENPYSGVDFKEELEYLQKKYGF